jgi:hypothetical protein
MAAGIVGFQDAPAFGSSSNTAPACLPSGAPVWLVCMKAVVSVAYKLLSLLLLLLSLLLLPLPTGLQAVRHCLPQADLPSWWWCDCVHTHSRGQGRNLQGCCGCSSAQVLVRVRVQP